jgi:hypothetical protein
VSEIVTHALAVMLGMVIGAACCPPWIDYLEREFKRRGG